MVEHELHTIDEIGVEELPMAVDGLKLDGWRIVQVLCVSTNDGFELSYTFGGGYAMRTLRVNVKPRAPVPSITPSYPSAYLYENEIRDLFGLRIERINVDWAGKVYDIATEKPFDRVRVAGSCVECPAPSIVPLGATGTAKNDEPDGGKP